MNLMNVAQSQGGVALPDAMLAPLVGSIGEDGFAPSLAQFLYALCGANHFAAFRLGDGELQRVAACCVQPERTAVKEVASYIEGGMWKYDPAVYEAQRCVKESGASIIHVDLDGVEYSRLRPILWPNVRDRIMLCVRNDSGVFGLTVLRMQSQSPFEHDADKKLRDRADLLMALLGKHEETTSTRPNMADALTNLSDIKRSIDVTGELPRREAEVCSRMLYGMSAVGISIDLSISEETVKTYRKRAYLRLGIGCERELLTWYLACWSRWRVRPKPRANDDVLMD